MVCANMVYRLLGLVTAVLFLISTSLSAVASAQPESPESGMEPRRIPIKARTMNGDFDEMFKMRTVRVAVPYSRSLYYIDKGHERGLVATNVRDFELYLNQKYKKKLKRRPITVYILPVTRDKLLQAVTSGVADIAAGNLTITERRLREVDFVESTLGAIHEIVVTGSGLPAPASVDELSGKTVHVRPSSSYYESLLALNERLAAKGASPVKLVMLPDALEDEDILEMVNAGILEIVVMDNWKAHLWAPLLPDIRLHNSLVLHADSHIGWAIRKGSSGLQQELEQFFKQPGRKQAPVTNYKQLMKKVKGLKNNTQDKELIKFQQMFATFKQYGDKYRFDPLLLAAQGYQESRLDQSARSHVGAIGVMQLMPSTGAAMRVGNIRITEPNIHAGTKYLDQLLERYFSDASFSETDRTLFAFAAYNAGPGNISKMRREADKRGLDPNVWFNNVEIVTAERIGSETTTYVRNVFKYYTAYKLETERKKDQERARRQIGAN